MKKGCGVTNGNGKTACDLLRRELCTGCGACRSVCPADAIRMEEDEEGFFYPVIDREKCVSCGRCERCCPSLHTPAKDGGPVRAAVHKDESERRRASSGGAFFALAEAVLGPEEIRKPHPGDGKGSETLPAGKKEVRRGAVCGAVYIGDFAVEHQIAESREDVRPMQGSKYVAGTMFPVKPGQAEAGCIVQAATLLKKGYRVLYTGTPCQIAGVRAALTELCTERELSGLILADILCHGVPSPRIWRTYLGQKEKAKGSRIVTVNFRNKERGWSRQALELCYADGSRYLAGNEDDPYYILYFKNVMLRPSCYECPYACRERVSDLTLGDYWGNEEAAEPVPAKEQGVSLVLVNTEKGAAFLKECDTLRLYEGDEKSAYQPLFDAPTKRPIGRESFWSCVRKEGEVAAIRRFGRLNAKEKLVKKLIGPLTRKMGIYKFAQKVYFAGGAGKKR